MPVKKVGDKWEVRGKEYSTEDAANEAYQEYLSKAMGIEESKKPHDDDFTKWSKEHGFDSVSEAAKHVMSNKNKYSKHVVEMANFAKAQRND